MLIPGFILYFIALLGLLEQPPFNIPDAEQEIVYGFYTEYSGTNYFMLKFAEFAEFMAVFAGVATLFMGAYKGIFWDGYSWFFLKMMLVAVVMMTIRAATPRITLKTDAAIFVALSGTDLSTQCCLGDVGQKSLFCRSLNDTYRYYEKSA